MITPNVFDAVRIRHYEFSEPDEPNPNDNGAESVTLTGKSSIDYSAALTAVNQSDHPSSSPGITGGRVTYAMDCYADPGDATEVQPGETIGCQGFSTGKKHGTGISGCGFSTVPGVNMIGTAGIAGTNGGIATGVLGALRNQAEIYNKIRRQRGCFHADNGSSREPLFIGTNGDGKELFKIDGAGGVMLGTPAGLGLTPCWLKAGLPTGNKVLVEVNGRLGELQIKWL